MGDPMKAFLKCSMLIFFLPTMAFGAELKLDPKSFFDSRFTIDSTYTSDGQNYEVSASGEAGPYGRVQLCYEFTDKQDLGDRGEYSGHAWTQNGETVVTATLQGVYVKKGKVFRLYGLNTVSDGTFHYAVGDIDFVAKTMNFNVSNVLVD